MRRAKEIELAITPRRSDVPRQRWLYEELRAAILQGRLSAGNRLPSTRDLARQQGIARGTVIAVFEQLSAEGYLVSATGKGTFVASTLPDRLLEGSWSAPLKSERPRPQSGLSARGRALARETFPIAGRIEPVRAFRPNQPDLAEFPLALWTRIASRRSRLSERQMLADSATQGFRPLREEIAGYLRRARGVVCSADQVIILSSVQQATDLCARLLLDPADAVWMEDPGYVGARRVLEAAGARVVSVPVDSSGLDVNAGRARAPSARLAYVTAGRQSPLGMPLALERRLALLAWAKEAQSIILEDDYNSEYRFDGSPLAALKSLDSDGRVIYAGSFSKLLFPSLRLAFVVMPDQLIAPFVAALSVTTRYTPPFTQQVLHEFMAEGHFGRHVRRMRLLYAERAEALSQSIISQLGGRLRVPQITTGLDTPAFLAADDDDAWVATLAGDAGLEMRALSSYAATEPTPSGLVLGFAAVRPPEISAAVTTLARVLEIAAKPKAPKRLVDERRARVAQTRKR